MAIKKNNKDIKDKGLPNVIIVNPEALQAVSKKYTKAIYELYREHRSKEKA